MEPTSVEAICNLLAKSRLLSGPDVKALYQRWQAEGRDGAADRARFARWLISNKYLTEYQAALLLKGHYKEHFLGDYKILDRLGKGRFAGVYHAVHRLGQVVAIKVLPPSRVKDPEVFGRFQREARLALKLKHPNLVRTFQTGLQDNLHYLVMEYLDGDTLEEILERRKKLPAPEAARIIYQALLGLQHIYEHDMIHRDLKPANLMLVPARKPGEPDTTTKATVKILDIGLGRALFDEDAPGPNQANLTTEGSVLGTPDYMAPEQARDAHKADIRADIYSLGCALYHAVAGQPPFADKNMVRVMIRHASEPPKPLREHTPDAPEALDKVLQLMLAKDPSQRFATPEKAARALQEYLQGTSVSARPVEAGGVVPAYAQWLESAGGDMGGGAAPAATVPYSNVVPPMAPVQPAPYQQAQAPYQPPVPQPAGYPPAYQAGPPQPAAYWGGVQQQQQAAYPAPPQQHAAYPPQQAPAHYPAPPPPEVDVELVPVNQPSRRSRDDGTTLGLNRRQWMMVGLGAGGVALAGGLGWLIAQVLRKKPTEEEPNTP